MYNWVLNLEYLKKQNIKGDIFFYLAWQLLLCGLQTILHKCLPKQTQQMQCVLSAHDHPKASGEKPVKAQQITPIK